MSDTLEHNAREEQQVNRACDSCRRMKVRCLPNERSSSGQCQRCSKSGRTCVYASPIRRRRGKGERTKLEELEKEVEAIRSLLSQGPSTTESNMDSPESTGVQIDRAESRPAHDGGNGNMYGVTSAQSTSSKLQDGKTLSPNAVSHAGQVARQLDVVDRGLLTLELATDLLNFFVNELTPQLPVTSFHRPQLDLRRRCPVLFLAMITAAAGRRDQNLYLLLRQEILRVLADRVMVDGDKSLELVQSMLVCGIWLHPPTDSRDLRFYQYYHMAAIMALDLGLGGRAGAKGRQPYRDPEFVRGDLRQDNMGDVDPQRVAEERRTYLACYIMCSSVSMALRRPNMLRTSSWIDECVQYLERSEQALPSDRSLVMWAKLQQIAEECGTLLSFDDPSAHVDLSEPNRRQHFHALEARLEQWGRAVYSDVFTAPLAVNFHVDNIYLHEFATHSDQSNDMSTSGTMKHDVADADTARMMSNKSVASCIHNAYALLNAFLRMDISQLQVTPALTFIRMTYGLIMITKLSVSVFPSSRQDELPTTDSTHSQFYLSTIHARLKQASQPEHAQVPRKFLRIVTRLGCWYQAMCMKKEEEQERGRSQSRGHYDHARNSAVLSPSVNSQTPQRMDIASLAGQQTTLPLQPANIVGPPVTLPMDSTFKLPLQDTPHMHNTSSPTFQVASGMAGVPATMPSTDFGQLAPQDFYMNMDINLSSLLYDNGPWENYETFFPGNEMNYFHSSTYPPGPV